MQWGLGYHSYTRTEGWSFERSKVTDDAFDNKLWGTGVGASMNLYIIQLDNITVTGAFGYEYVSFSGNFLKQSGAERTYSNSFTGGVLLHHSSLRHHDTGFIPYLGYHLLSLDIITQSHSGGSQQVSGNIQLASFGFQLGFRHRGDNRFIGSVDLIVTEPFRQTYDKEFTVSFSFGYMWASKRNKLDE